MGRHERKGKVLGIKLLVWHRLLCGQPFLNFWNIGKVVAQLLVSLYGGDDVVDQ